MALTNEQNLQVKIDQQKDTIDNLREAKQELLEEVLAQWDKVNVLENLLTNEPKRVILKTRTKNNPENRLEYINAWGKEGTTSYGTISVQDRSTVENKTASNKFQLRVADVDMNRNGVAELRDELQRLLDFNPQG